MKSDLLLRLALLGSRIFGVVLGLILAALVFFFIHWHINSNYYDSVHIVVLNGEISIDGTVSGIDKGTECEKGYSLKKFSAGSFYFTYLQLLTYVILLIFIMREVIQILRSVHVQKIFSTDNIRSFRRLGKLAFILAVTQSFYFIQAGEESFFSFSPEFSMLMIALAAFVLAAIFKEGQDLYEQNQLTI